MEILDARETEARLPYPELADSIREVMDGMREGSWRPDPGRARRSIRLGGCHSAGGCPPLVQQARRHDRLQECRPRPVGPCRRPYGLRVLNKRITLSAVDNHMPRPPLLGVPPGEDVRSCPPGSVRQGAGHRVPCEERYDERQ